MSVLDLCIRILHLQKWKQAIFTSSVPVAGSTVDNHQQFNADCAATLILNTLSVAVEWLILAQPSLRCSAHASSAHISLFR